MVAAPIVLFLMFNWLSCIINATVDEMEMYTHRGFCREHI